jgi:hypothetical protein
MAEGAPNPPPAVGSPVPATTPRRRRRLGLRAKVLFALVPTLVIVGGTEGVFRIREKVREGRPTRRRYSPRVPDAWRNMVLNPGEHFEESGRTADINALGMRAPAPRDPKPPVRIVCIGGSSTYGLFVSANEKTWPARVERELARPDVEVLNAGCPAWDVRTSQTNLELRLYDALRPDVVVACHVYNDVVANLDPRYDEHSRIEWDTPETTRLRNLWHGHSALYRFVVARKSKGLEEELKRKAPAMGQAGLAAYERNLRRLVDRTRARGAKLLLVTEPTCYRPTLAESEAAKVPSMEQWFHDLSPLEYPALMQALAAYQDVVRRVAKETGSPLCDLERLMPKDVALFESPVHHTDAGEELVGRLVAKALVDAGLVPPPPR